jgi:hypothetical protein
MDKNKPDQESFRIVKKGARGLRVSQILGDIVYLKSDILEIKEDIFLATPDEYKPLSQSLNPHQGMIINGREYGDARVWDDGFAAGISACLKELGEL